MIYKNKDMAGKSLNKLLRHKIILQEVIESFSKTGLHSLDWVDKYTVWAERNNLFGKEYYVAREVNEENTIIFTIRYAPFIETINIDKFRIKQKDKYYNIKQIDRLLDNDSWVKIRALESDENG